MIWFSETDWEDRLADWSSWYRECDCTCDPEEECTCCDDLDDSCLDDDELTEVVSYARERNVQKTTAFRQNVKESTTSSWWNTHSFTCDVDATVEASKTSFEPVVYVICRSCKLRVSISSDFVRTTHPHSRSSCVPNKFPTCFEMSKKDVGDVMET